MRYWRVLAWFLGSAVTACLAYTKTCRARNSKALPSLEAWRLLLLDALAKVWHDVRPEQQGFGSQHTAATAICGSPKAAPCKHRLGISMVNDHSLLAKICDAMLRSSCQHGPQMAAAYASHAGGRCVYQLRYLPHVLRFPTPSHNNRSCPFQAFPQFPSNFLASLAT